MWFKALLLCSLTAAATFISVGVLLDGGNNKDVDSSSFLAQTDKETLVVPASPVRHRGGGGVQRPAGGATASSSQLSHTLQLPLLTRTPLSPSIKLGTFATIEDDLLRILSNVSINGAVLATTASREFAKVLTNWLCHVKKLGMTNVVVFALDLDTARQVHAAGVAYVLDRTFARADGSIGTFASKSYLQAVYSKTRHQRAVLAAGFHLFFSDTDIPWTHNWMPEVATWAGEAVDIMLSPGWPWHDLNTGFFYARSTPATLRLIDLLLELEDNLAAGSIDNTTRNSYT
jgi:hypothetical protein